jgi:hypothetical protein
MKNCTTRRVKENRGFGLNIRPEIAVSCEAVAPPECLAQQAVAQILLALTHSKRERERERERESIDQRVTHVLRSRWHTHTRRQLTILLHRQFRLLIFTINIIPVSAPLNALCISISHKAHKAHKEKKELCGLCALRGRQKTKNFVGDKKQRT